MHDPGWLRMMMSPMKVDFLHPLEYCVATGDYAQQDDRTDKHGNNHQPDFRLTRHSVLLSLDVLLVRNN
jgi:hypothetical protein